MLESNDEMVIIFKSTSPADSDVFVKREKNGDIVLWDEDFEPIIFTPNEWNGVIQAAKDGKLDLDE